jgi:hypothetical protein
MPVTTSETAVGIEVGGVDEVDAAVERGLDELVTPSWLTPATVAHMPSPLPKVMAPRHISETISRYCRVSGNALSYSIQRTGGVCASA